MASPCTQMVSMQKINELNRRQLLNKNRSITRLHAPYYTRVKRVADNGGVRLVSAGKVNKEDVWEFEVTSGTKQGTKYSVFIRFKNILELLEEYAMQKLYWKKDLSGLDYRKMANIVLHDSDLESRCSCLTGDTKVPLLDGRVLTMTELLEEYGTDRQFWIFSSDEKGDFIPAKARCLGITGFVDSLIEVTLDNGKKIKTTIDHKYRMRDGSYRQAQHLKCGDSLMPLYLKQSKETKAYKKRYLKVKINSKQSSYRNQDIWKMVHRVVAETVLAKEKIYVQDKEKHIVVHHKEFNTLDNRPEKLEWMGRNEHIRYHAKLCKNWLEGCIRAWKDAEFRKIHTEKNRKAGRISQIKRPDIFAKGRQIRKEFMQSPEGSAYITKINNKRWSNPEAHRYMSEKLKGVRKSKEHCESLKKAWTPERREKQSKTMKERRKTFSMSRDEKGRFYNHKIVKISMIVLDKQIPVYDLTVEKYDNFALEAGIYVHNCPADLYYGGQYIRTQRKAKYTDPENRPPVIRNPKQYGAYCKHTQLVMDVLPMYGGTMARYLATEYEKQVEKFEKRAK